MAADDLDAMYIALRINLRWVIAWGVLLSLQMLVVSLPLALTCHGGHALGVQSFVSNTDVLWCCEQAQWV